MENPEKYCDGFVRFYGAIHCISSKFKELQIPLKQSYTRLLSGYSKPPIINQCKRLFGDD